MLPGFEGEPNQRPAGIDPLISEQEVIAGKHAEQGDECYRRAKESVMEDRKRQGLPFDENDPLILIRARFMREDAKGGRPRPMLGHPHKMPSAVDKKSSAANDREFEN
jgi:hypothetical protein